MKNCNFFLNHRDFKLCINGDQYFELTKFLYGSTQSPPPVIHHPSRRPYVMPLNTQSVYTLSTQKSIAAILRTHRIHDYPWIGLESKTHSVSRAQVRPVRFLINETINNRTGLDPVLGEVTSYVRNIRSTPVHTSLCFYDGKRLSRPVTSHRRSGGQMVLPNDEGIKADFFTLNVDPKTQSKTIICMIT